MYNKVINYSTVCNLTVPRKRSCRIRGLVSPSLDEWPWAGVGKPISPRYMDKAFLVGILRCPTVDTCSIDFPTSKIHNSK